MEKGFEFNEEMLEQYIIRLAELRGGYLDSFQQRIFNKAMARRKNGQG